MSDIATILNINLITLYQMNKTRLHVTWCCKAEWHWDGAGTFFCSDCRSDVTEEVLLIMDAFENLN